MWPDPDLRVKLTHEHLSAISGIALDGRLFMQVRQTSYDAAVVVGFLPVLLRKIGGKIVLIWDGASIHRSHEIKDFLNCRGNSHVQLSVRDAHKLVLTVREFCPHGKNETHPIVYLTGFTPLFCVILL